MDSKLKITNPQETRQFKLIVRGYSGDYANCLWGRKLWCFSCQVRLLRFSLLAQQTTNLQSKHTVNRICLAYTRCCKHYPLIYLYSWYMLRRFTVALSFLFICLFLFMFVWSTLGTVEGHKIWNKSKIYGYKYRSNKWKYTVNMYNISIKTI